MSTSSSSSSSSSSPNSASDQECPLCMETLDLDDKSFYPCTCGYQICRFCWHRILTSSSSSTDSSNSCPACRKTYSENPANFKPISVEDIQLKLKQQRKLKDLQKKAKTVEGRKHLGELRVVQKNLVFVVGITPRIADAELLKKGEYFGRFGKIHKVVVNCVSGNTTTPCTSSTPTPTLSYGAYITYTRSEDALRAIQSVNNIPFDGKTIKASLGTTKYCSHFMRNQVCPKSDCMYLHSQGDSEASFTKEDMQQGKHQEYERKLIEEFRREQLVVIQKEKDGGEEDVLVVEKPKPLMIPLLYKSEFDGGFVEVETEAVGGNFVEEEEQNDVEAREVLPREPPREPSPSPPPQQLPQQHHHQHPSHHHQQQPPPLFDFNPFSETQSQFESIIQAEMANWQLSQNSRQNQPPPGFDNNLDEWIDPAIIYSKSSSSQQNRGGHVGASHVGRGGGNIGHLLGNSLLNDIFCGGGGGGGSNGQGIGNGLSGGVDQQRHFPPGPAQPTHPQQANYFPTQQQQQHTYYKPPPGFQPSSSSTSPQQQQQQQQFINNNFFNNFPF